jgi:phytoene desaturase
MHIGIIGAGVAGLAASVRLAAQGHTVEVFEANDYPGGKLSAFDLDGYRFDAGPSLFTMPQYVEALFEAAGQPMDPHFAYQREEVACRYFWPDGHRLTAWGDRSEFAKEVEQQLGVAAPRVERFLAQSAIKYRLAGWIFLEKSLHKAATWLRWPVVKAMLRLPSFDLWKSMHAVHKQHFPDSPHLVQLFDRYATYNGSDPYRAPGMLTIIPHFEHNIGVFYPTGGMVRITQSIYELAERSGVRFHFNVPIKKIETTAGRTTGLTTADGQTHAFDAVVSNMDVYYTYKKLLPERRHPERILRQPKSTSALIFYWGIRHNFEQLGLHNIFFSADYATEFSTMARGEVSDDPTVYINITSKNTPSDAPAGCENWFVMVNVPADNGQDWDAMIPRIRAQVLAKLSRELGTNVADLVACEAILDPREIDRKTASHRGALYGYSSNNQMAAFLRHANFSRDIKGLYFVGGSVHPGGGIPLCLLSAQITSELIGKK